MTLFSRPKTVSRDAPPAPIIGPLISMHNMEKVFETAAGRTYVLRRITGDIQPGEFVSIMGPSGAGKSTLLHIIGMHDSAWTGEYYFLDQPVHRLGAKERAKLHKQYIGFVFQSYHLLDDLTVAEAVALVAGSPWRLYIHINDNDGRWDWDMLPGAFHLWEFVELFYTLRKLGYDNDWYAFDVYPKELDTVQNFAAAIQLTRKLEAITDRIDVPTMERLLRERNSAKTLPYLYSLL